jgi:hypothetical protein
VAVCVREFILAAGLDQGRHVRPFVVELVTLGVVFGSGQDPQPMLKGGIKARWTEARFIF